MNWAYIGNFHEVVFSGGLAMCIVHDIFDARSNFHIVVHRH